MTRLWLLPAVLLGCGVSPTSTLREIEPDYAVDTRTGLCFATGVGPYVTNVPCSPRVCELAGGCAL